MFEIKIEYISCWWSMRFVISYNLRLRLVDELWQYTFCILSHDSNYDF